MTIKTMLKAASFAHLLGLPKASRAEDDDEDKKQRPDESDDDYAKRMEGGDEKDDDEKAEDEDEKSKAEADDENDQDEGDEKKGRKAKRAEEGDDDESMQAARRGERARCAAIFASDAAGSRPDLAAHLAFNTEMSDKDAVALLNAAAAGGGRGQSLAQRMAAEKIANVGTGAASGDPTSPSAMAARIAAAAAKARGEK